MKIKILIAGIALGLTFPAAAMAMGFYAGIEGGTATVTDQTGTVAADLVNSLGGSAYVTQSANVGIFRGFVGYGIIPMVAIELGYVQTGDANLNITGVTGGNVAYAGTGTESVHGFDLSGILHPILFGPGSGLFLRAGMSDYTETATLSLNSNFGSTYGSSSQSGTGENFGIGYDFGVGVGVLRTELTYAQNIANDSSSKSTSFQVGYYW